MAISSTKKFVTADIYILKFNEEEKTNFHLALYIESKNYFYDFKTKEFYRANAGGYNFTDSNAKQTILTQKSFPLNRENLEDVRCEAYQAVGNRDLFKNLLFYSGNDFSNVFDGKHDFIECWQIKNIQSIISVNQSAKELKMAQQRKIDEFNKKRKESVRNGYEKIF